MRELINELDSKHKGNIPVQEIISLAKERGIDESKAEEIINNMKRDGEIFEPRYGEIKKMPR